MMKLTIFLVVFLMLGCKTKTILVENVRNTRDSTENVELKQRITVSEKALNEARMELKINEQKASKLIYVLKKAIELKLPFDQMIAYPSFVHFSHSKMNRRMVLYNGKYVGKRV